MIRLLLLIGLFITTLKGFAQEDYSAVDKKCKSTPDTLTTANAIALYLTKDLKSEIDKTRAIYIWITHNIKYDLAQLNTLRRFQSSQEIIDEVLIQRQGVCQHYSELFYAMSESVGLNSYLIKGYTRDATGDIAKLSHVWNGIKIDSNYYFIDATWAAGYQLNGKYVHEFRDNYFLISPKVFIRDHMPFDPIWQFLSNPINNTDFVTSNFSKLDTLGNFSFVDSIKIYEDSERLIQLENSNRRIAECGVANKLIQDEIDENLLQLTNVQYNLAVDTLNYGIEQYNLYITHKNRQFRNPKLEDLEVKEMIENAGIGMYAANELFYSLFSPNTQLNAMIVDARDKMPSLIVDLENEKDFVDRYLNKWKPFRIFMFYQFAY